MKSEIKYSHRIFAMIICIIMLFFTCDNSITALAQEFDSLQATAQQEATNKDIKSRLLDKIIYDGWDPYASDMTIDEFFALMELFDDGALPLDQVSEYASFKGAGVGENQNIPRTKFMFAGLDDYKRIDGSHDDGTPLEYKNTENYEGNGSGGYYYPSGLDPYGAGYKRPPTDWDGIATDGDTNRVVLVSRDVNADNDSVAGDVIQDLFAEYTGYYVKQVTIDGVNINVLGMIEVGGRYIYYYLSAEDQNTQVSTTTLPDNAKFIIEYVPIEHTVNYKVELSGSDVTTDYTPSDVVFFGKNAHQDVSWADGIFGENRPLLTTDGAYSFDVTVPYGYKMDIYISIEMSPEIKYTRPTDKDSFPVNIKHTGTKQDTYDSWLKAYCDYLISEGFVADESDFNNHITKEGDIDQGNISLKWNGTNDPNKPAHDSILERMSERINDFTEHNDGWALGAYPNYSIKSPAGFKLLPDSTKGPTEHTMSDTFYNHFVKADRTITAVLTKQPDPTFDVSQILQKSSGAVERGSSAKEDFAFGDLDADYEWHINGIGDEDPLIHPDKFPNIDTDDGWSWTNPSKFRNGARDMRCDEETGTYYYSWVFQTNTGNNYLDAFEVNGISIQVPYYPKYNYNNYTVNGKPETADDAHPYYTETKLADGSTLRLEFMFGQSTGGDNARRHYRVTVTGARSNVVVTGLNLMTYSAGAPEFATYNLVGVYSDLGGYSQTAPAIEYYNKSTNVWTRVAQSNVVVDSIDYDGGDTSDGKYGANIRFKVTEGYGSPYYTWTNRHGDVIADQSSVDNPILSLAEAASLSEGEGGLINGKLDSRYIYKGDDDYYYICVTKQKGDDGTEYKIALLNIVARSVRFTVRYVPTYEAENGKKWSGFLLHNTKDNDTANDTLTPLAPEDVKIDLDSMPSFDHNPEICDLWEMAKDNVTGEVREEYQQILHQYDDNGVGFYDMIYHNMATIATNNYGTIRPRSTENYVFVDWVVVGEDFNPVTDTRGRYIRFLGGAIDFTKYAGYAVKHVAFGNADTDIHVLRLMPVWEKIDTPYIYNVVINRVDKEGNIYADYFHDYWNEVLTKMTDDDDIFVFLNKDAGPLKSWIANHPTYNFWDDVNNVPAVRYQTVSGGRAGGDPETQALEQAIVDYLGESDENLLNALKNEPYLDHENNEQPANNTFLRYGSDIFVANDKNSDEKGTIVIWMYEDKGGVVFHKDVLPDAYAPDDEFYFSVNAPNGEYTAYPEFVYDSEGNKCERIYTDAMSVVIENGRIKSIDGAETDHFSLRAGSGIALYGNEGEYIISETGSKSGGLYTAEVKYLDDNGNSKDTEGRVTLPNSGSRISGTNTTPDDNSLTAKAVVGIGESKVLQTLTFTNQTHSLVIKSEVVASMDDAIREHAFTYNVEFDLPEGETPPNVNGLYYYNMIIYKKSNDEYVVKDTQRLNMNTSADADDPQQSYMRAAANTDNIWHSRSFDLLPDEYAVIVLPVPEATGQTISYKASETKPTENETWYLQGAQYERTGSLRSGEQTEEIYVNLPGQTSIYVSKRVVRSDGETDETSFSFTITLEGTYTDDNGEERDANTFNGTFGDHAFIGGVADFTLKDGESVFFSPLPAGLTYSVNEEVSIDYAATSSNANGVLERGETAIVEFVNIYKTNDGYLVITEEGGEANESFLYKITDENGSELIVSVKGGGQTVVFAPMGTYTITEISDWSWKYEDGVCYQSTAAPKGKTADVTIGIQNMTSEDAVHADYSHKRNDKVWVGGENSEDNLFAEIPSDNEQPNTDSRDQEIALLTVVNNMKKKRYINTDEPKES